MVINSPNRSIMLSPSKERCSDRFIPCRAGNTWQTSFATISDGSRSGVTTKKARDTGEGGRDGLVYSCLLKNELLGAEIEDLKGQCDERRNVASGERRNLFQYTPTKRSGVDDASSPYSLSPVSPKSQKLLQSPQKATRKISRIPFKVLDAPELQDDFYLNLVDWSSENVLSVGLGSCVYLWSACTSQVTRLCDLTSDANSVTSVSWNERGNLVAVGTHHGYVQVWDVAVNKMVNKLQGHSARVGALAWNRDVLSSGSRDRLILQRDVRTPSIAPERRLAGHRQEDPVPTLERNSVLVQVKACALSSQDERSLKELFRKAGKIRFAVGQDVAGIIRAVGSDVTTLRKGDEVVGIIPLDYDQSGCSEYVMLHEFDVVLKPEVVSFVDAAGCIGDAVKAYTALHYLGRMCSGDSVVVLNGASSFGSLCVQLAHHWGAKVITTSSSLDEKLYLQSLDVELAQIIETNEKNSSLKSVCMLETGNLGVDIVVDQGVCQYPQNLNIYSEKKDTFCSLLPSKHDIISCLAVGGKWITSKANLQLDPPNSRLLFLRCATVGFLFEQAWMLSSAQQGRYQHILMDIMEKVATKTIRPNIHHTVSFDGVVEAAKNLSEVKVGKVVMTF